MVLSLTILHPNGILDWFVRVKRTANINNFTCYWLLSLVITGDTWEQQRWSGWLVSYLLLSNGIVHSLDILGVLPGDWSSRCSNSGAYTRFKEVVEQFLGLKTPVTQA